MKTADITLGSNWRLTPPFTWRPTDETSLTILTLYQHDPKSGAYGAVPALGSVYDIPPGKISWDFMGLLWRRCEPGHAMDGRIHFSDTNSAIRSPSGSTSAISMSL